MTEEERNEKLIPAEEVFEKLRKRLGDRDEGLDPVE
jgi:hypothetical protein